MKVKAKNIRGKNVQMEETNDMTVDKGKGKPKLKIGKPEKEVPKAEDEPKEKLGYSIVFMMSDLVGLLPIPRNTMDEFEKIKGIKDQLQEAIKEYQAKIGKVCEKHGIKEGQQPTGDAMDEINKVFQSASSLEVERIQQYTHEHAFAMALGGQHRDGKNFNLETINLVTELLTKKDN